MMRMDSQPKERRPVPNASGKIDQVVRQVLIPLLSMPIGGHVSFRASGAADAGRELIERLRESDPDSVRDREAFVARMGQVYDGVFPSELLDSL